MTNVSRTNRNGQRPATDLYQTPGMCTRALRIAAPDIFQEKSRWWEPACGKLAIANELAAFGHTVIYGDKFKHLDRRFTLAHGDFFEERRLRAPNIITNPPYGKKSAGGRTENIADDFIRHALSLGPEFAVFFLPLAHWAGDSRTDILEHSGLWRVYIFRTRPTLSPDHLGLKSGGVTDYAWFVWKRGYKGRPDPIRISLAREPKRRAA